MSESVSWSGSAEQLQELRSSVTQYQESPTSTRLHTVFECLKKLLKVDLKGNRAVEPSLVSVISTTTRAFPLLLGPTLEKSEAVSHLLPNEDAAELWLKQATSDDTLGVFLAKLPSQLQVVSAYAARAPIRNMQVVQEVVGLLQSMKGTFPSPYESQVTHGPPGASTHRRQPSGIHIETEADALRHHRRRSSIERFIYSDNVLTLEEWPTEQTKQGTPTDPQAPAASPQDPVQELGTVLSEQQDANNSAPSTPSSQAARLTASTHVLKQGIASLMSKRWKKGKQAKDPLHPSSTVPLEGGVQGTTRVAVLLLPTAQDSLMGPDESLIKLVIKCEESAGVSPREGLTGHLTDMIDEGVRDRVPKGQPPSPPSLLVGATSTSLDSPLGAPDGSPPTEKASRFGGLRIPSLRPRSRVKTPVADGEGEKKAEEATSLSRQSLDLPQGQQDRRVIFNTCRVQIIVNPGDEDRPVSLVLDFRESLEDGTGRTPSRGLGSVFQKLLTVKGSSTGEPEKPGEARKDAGTSEGTKLSGLTVTSGAGAGRLASIFSFRRSTQTVSDDQSGKISGKIRGESSVQENYDIEHISMELSMGEGDTVRLLLHLRTKEGVEKVESSKPNFDQNEQSRSRFDWTPRKKPDAGVVQGLNSVKQQQDGGQGGNSPLQEEQQPNKVSPPPSDVGKNKEDAMSEGEHPGRSASPEPEGRLRWPLGGSLSVRSLMSKWKADGVRTRSDPAEDQEGLLGAPSSVSHTAGGTAKDEPQLQDNSLAPEPETPQKASLAHLPGVGSAPVLPRVPSIRSSGELSSMMLTEAQDLAAQLRQAVSDVFEESVSAKGFLGDGSLALKKLTVLIESVLVHGLRSTQSGASGQAGWGSSIRSWLQVGGSLTPFGALQCLDSSGVFGDEVDLGVDPISKMRLARGLGDEVKINMWVRSSLNNQALGLRLWTLAQAPDVLAPWYHGQAFLRLPHVSHESLGLLRGLDAVRFLMSVSPVKDGGLPEGTGPAAEFQWPGAKLGFNTSVASQGPGRRRTIAPIRDIRVPKGDSVLSPPSSTLLSPVSSHDVDEALVWDPFLENISGEPGAAEGLRAGCEAVAAELEEQLEAGTLSPMLSSDLGVALSRDRATPSPVPCVLTSVDQPAEQTGPFQGKETHRWGLAQQHDPLAPPVDSMASLPPPAAPRVPPAGPLDSPSAWTTTRESLGSQPPYHLSGPRLGCTAIPLAPGPQGRVPGQGSQWPGQDSTQPWPPVEESGLLHQLQASSSSPSRFATPEVSGRLVRGADACPEVSTLKTAMGTTEVCRPIPILRGGEAELHRTSRSSICLDPLSEGSTEVAGLDLPWPVVCGPPEELGHSRDARQGVKQDVTMCTSPFLTKESGGPSWVVPDCTAPNHIDTHLEPSSALRPEGPHVTAEDISGISVHDTLTQRDPQTGEDYTTYLVQVFTCQGDSWVVRHRFREFVDLYYSLKRQRAVLPLSWYDISKARHVTGWSRLSKGVVEARREMLDMCMKDMIKHKDGICLLTYPQVLSFLSPGQKLLDGGIADSCSEGGASSTCSWLENEEVSGRVPLNVRSSLDGMGSRETSRAPSEEVGSQLEALEVLREDFEDGSSSSTIKLILDLPSSVPSDAELYNRQQGLCRSCGGPLPPVIESPGGRWFSRRTSSGGHGKGPRRCHYTRYLYCHSCQLDDTALIPSRVLHKWDFNKYPVCETAKEYLNSTYNQPVLCVAAVQPGLYARVPLLMQARETRQHISQMLGRIGEEGEEGRRKVEALKKAAGPRAALLEGGELWSMRDLEDISKGVFSELCGWLQVMEKKVSQVATSVVLRIEGK